MFCKVDDIFHYLCLVLDGGLDMTMCKYIRSKVRSFRFTSKNFYHASAQMKFICLDALAREICRE